jgi:RiboL-PSP-HEPN
MLHWEYMDNDAKALASTFLRQRSAEESLLYRGMVISLSGAFEQFVRRTVRDSVLAINAKGRNYDLLDDHLKKENLYRTGIALGTVHEPLDYLDLDYESLAKNVGTCFRGSMQALLNAEAFAIFLSIISPKHLTDALKRIGMELHWDDLGKIQSMRDALDLSDTRETAKAAEEFLRRFGQMRNKIAHTGNSGIVVSDDDLQQLLKIFRAFARGFTSIIEAEIAKRPPQ